MPKDIGDSLDDGFAFFNHEAGLTGDPPQESDRESFDVLSPSGDPVPLLSESEVTFYNDKVMRYMDDYKMENISDLMELSRLLLHETMVFRWSQWMLSNGTDYNGDIVSMTDLKKDVRDYSKEIRETKAALGADKKSRDAAKGGTTANFINKLLLSAVDFCMKRNEEVIKAYTLWKQLDGLLTFHDNCLPGERTEFACHEEDIIQFIRDKRIEFDEIDDKFRNERQRYWIRELG